MKMVYKIVLLTIFKASVLAAAAEQDAGRPIDRVSVVDAAPLVGPMAEDRAENQALMDAMAVAGLAPNGLDNFEAIYGIPAAARAPVVLALVRLMSLTIPYKPERLGVSDEVAAANDDHGLSWSYAALDIEGAEYQADFKNRVVATERMHIDHARERMYKYLGLFVAACLMATAK